MNIFYSVTAGAALMLISAAASAQTTQSTQNTQNASDQQAPEVSIRARDGAGELTLALPEQHRKMWPADYRDYVRQYSLSNGMTMRIFPSGNNMYAALDNGEWHKLVSSKGNTFTALDQRLAMRIQLLDNDEAAGDLVLMLPVRSPDNGSLADTTVDTTVRVALR